MKKACTLVLVLFLGINRGWAEESRAPKEDIVSIVNFLKRPVCNHVIRCTDNQKVIAFYSNGWQYRLAWEESLRSPKGMLLIFISPAEASERAFVSSLVDEGLDGAVDYGNVGFQHREREDSKHFDSGVFSKKPIGGSELRDYWQKRYREAIHIARQALPKAKAE